MANNGGVQDDIQSCSGKATTAFNKLAKIWRSGQLSKNIAMLLHRCKICKMAKRDEVKLGTFLHKHLWRALNIYWLMGVTIEEIR